MRSFFNRVPPVMLEKQNGISRLQLKFRICRNITERESLLLPLFFFFHAFIRTFFSNMSTKREYEIPQLAHSHKILRTMNAEQLVNKVPVRYCKRVFSAALSVTFKETRTRYEE